jgi:ACS family pantothenate transporter-like MFS transporter
MASLAPTGNFKTREALNFQTGLVHPKLRLSVLLQQDLDQTNISNAYVSGMKEELGFGPGNELSWMNTYFNAGYIIGGPLSNLVLTVVAPRIWLPSCMSAWSLFVLFLYKCDTAPQFYALRFFVGFFESAAFPGIHYVLGSWFKKSGLARRSSLFVISSVLGQMFSGYLQSALYTGIDGKGGLSAGDGFSISISFLQFQLPCTAS